MLVFSSVDSTQSASFSGLPSQTPSYKSRTRPAFSANRGSLGKIQVRWYQGRMASSDSQRQSVVFPMDATSPLRMVSSRMSAILIRDSGNFNSVGSSHAKALIATTTSGGKARRAASPVALLKAFQSAFEKSFPPLAYDLEGRVQPGGDLLILHVLSRVERDFSPDYVDIR